ncbi:conserved hypothetical protein [Methylocella tundrae]|uniref:Protein AaeX n=1 Tax=Methylocella tundrae TaxID=227605 RepID=A0A8B6M7F0_METTU|nr:DUF1656 domain-containing protein [Methylocella tundrae]VTZ26561.1 conserved hypothetical protein [Methylocella tundrae]VTZ50678.1 conserved hypothetical protein [Methylocella tundrae]
MMGEIDIYGVFVPSLFIWMVAGFFLSLTVRRILSWCGLYRFIWRRPLFDLALYVVLLGVVVSTTTRLFS